MPAPNLSIDPFADLPNATTRAPVDPFGDLPDAPRSRPPISVVANPFEADPFADLPDAPPADIGPHIIALHDPLSAPPQDRGATQIQVIRNPEPEQVRAPGAPPVVGPAEAVHRELGAAGLQSAAGFADTLGVGAQTLQRTLDNLGDTTGGAPAAPLLRRVGDVIRPATEAVAKEANRVGDVIGGFAKGAETYQPSGFAAKAAGFAGSLLGTGGQLVISPEAMAITTGTRAYREAINQGDPEHVAVQKGLIEAGITEAGGRVPMAQESLRARVGTGAAVGGALPEVEHRALNAVDPRIAPDASLPEIALGAGTMGALPVLHAGLDASSRFLTRAPERSPMLPGVGPEGAQQAPEVTADNASYRTPEQRIDPAQGPQPANPFDDLPDAERVQPAATSADPFADLPNAGATPVPEPAAPVPANTNAEPPRIAQGGPSAVPGSYEVITPRGRRVPVQNEIAEADSLVPSHTQDFTPNPAYPPELQPRDRGRAASQEQVARIAQNLEPSLLGPGVSATEGAPIVGPDNVIESGNARTMAIQRAYADKLPGSDSYRQWLQGQGFDVSGFDNPVLVRRRIGDMTPEDRAAFTREANERTTLGVGATEQAQADAKAMPDWLLDSYQGGDVLSAPNRDFVRKYLDTVAPTERGSLLGEHGELSQEGARRLENAVFAKAYEAPDVLGSLREDQDSNIRAIGGALVDAAPTWAKMRAEAVRGNIRPEVDATQGLVDAVRLVRRARQEGKPVVDLVNQRDAFSGEVSPEARGFLDLMFRDRGYRRPASRKAISDALRFYAEEAGRKSAGPGLFAGEPQQGPADILAAAARRRDGGLFGNDDVLQPGVAAEMRRPAVGSDDRREGDVSRSVYARPSLGTEGSVGAEPNLDVSSSPGLDNLFSDLPQVQDARTRNAAAGANYVPFVRDKVTGTARAEPIRREEILHDFVKGMDAPLYEGRIKSRKALGFYRPTLEEVRLKKTSDIETAAHEMAHLLDGRVPEVRQQWNPATNANAAIRDELRGVSYDQSKLYEGFAEFVRLWMTQPEEALNKAPKFYRWFEDFASRSERYGPTLRQAQKGMTEWFAQDALTRARSKIGMTKDINSGLTSPFDGLRQSIVDDLHGIANAERQLRGDVQAGGAYQTARLTRGASAMIEGTLKYGAPVIQADRSVRYVGEGLQHILEPVADRLDDFLMYAVGRSAHELMAQGREHLFTKAEIAGMRALETPEFRQAFDEYQGWNNAILDFAQAKGIISGPQRAKWKRAQYIPFYRIDKAAAGAFGPVPGAWSVKALKGGTGNLRDVLGNMIGNASMLIRAALANEVRLKVAELSQLQGGAKFLAKIPTDERSVHIPADEIKRRVLEALGVSHPDQLSPDEQLFLDDIITGLSPFAQFTLRNQAPTGPNVIAALKGGKPEFYEVADPLLYRALTSLNRPAQHWALRMLSIPRRIGQASVTLSLDFMAANIARDTMMASIMSKDGFRPLIDSAKGFKSRLLSDPTYREFIANGGGFASQFLDENKFRVHLEKFYGRKGIDYRTVLDAPSKVLHGLERIAEAFEASTRVGEYQRARAKGRSPAASAFEAREVSTDFAMRGDSRTIGALYDTALFLKAAVVSLDRAYRGFTKDPNRMHIAAKTALLAAASAGLAALNYGNPLYDELPDWDRDTAWHFFIPTIESLKAWAEGRELPPIQERYIHLRFPKLWEIGAISSIAERGIERFLNNEPRKLVGDTARITQGVFNMSLMPQALAPLYEQATNRLQFFDRPIETEAMQERLPFSRSNEYTSKTVRAIGEATKGLPPDLQVSPARLEALLRGYLNTWAVYGLSLSDAAFFDGSPDIRTDQYPVLRRFSETTPNRSSRYVQELHDLITEATETRRTISWLAKSWRPGMADPLYDRPENARYEQMTFADKQLQGFAKDMELVTGADLPDLRQIVNDHIKVARDPSFTNEAHDPKIWNDVGALKRLMLDRLIQERNDFSRMIVQSVDEQKQAPAR